MSIPDFIDDLHSLFYDRATITAPGNGEGQRPGMYSIDVGDPARAWRIMTAFGDAYRNAGVVIEHDANVHNVPFGQAGDNSHLSFIRDADALDAVASGVAVIPANATSHPSLGEIFRQPFSVNWFANSPGGHAEIERNAAANETLCRRVDTALELELTSQDRETLAQNIRDIAGSQRSTPYSAHAQYANQIEDSITQMTGRSDPIMELGNRNMLSFLAKQFDRTTPDGRTVQAIATIGTLSSSPCPDDLSVLDGPLPVSSSVGRPSDFHIQVGSAAVAFRIMTSLGATYGQLGVFPDPAFGDESAYTAGAHSFLLVPEVRDAVSRGYVVIPRAITDDEIFRRYAMSDPAFKADKESALGLSIDPEKDGAIGERIREGGPNLGRLASMIETEITRATGISGPGRPPSRG